MSVRSDILLTNKIDLLDLSTIDLFLKSFQPTTSQTTKDNKKHNCLSSERGVMTFILSRRH